MNEKQKIKSLIEFLNSARDAYYNDSAPIMEDSKYDKYFDELKTLEEETHIIYPNSPTQTVGYEVKSKLEKVKHSHLMLSLDKTKSVNDLVKFSNGKDCVLSLKMDGLTVLNTFDNGKLVQAETRGNGEIGELITHNAMVFENLPVEIPCDKKFEIEGEAIITMKDFEKINSKLSDDEKYKNPRNLVSGSVRQLDNKITEKRHVNFICWKLPFGFTTYTEGFKTAEEFGFTIVPFVKYNSKTDNIEEKIQYLKEIAEKKGYPIDGLVITYDNIEYGKSLGSTGHHPRHSLAFKFREDEEVTTLREIEWSIGKTGQITPVAIFDPVELDGTTVNRASLHNISIIKDLKLGIKDEITVFKANQIIPQIRENLTKSNNFSIPFTCPVCGSPTKIVKENDSEVLICTNPDCKGKLLGKMVHFCSKNAINIDGMSEATLELLINKGWISTFKDLYNLPDDVITYWKNHVSGFSSHSVNKLLKSIEASRETDLEHFIYALSIPMIGKTASKLIAKECEYDFGEFIRSMIMLNPKNNRFKSISGIGDSIITSLDSYFMNYGAMVFELSKEFNFNKPEVSKSTNSLSGKTFVITGSVIHYSNRDELKKVIESYGGKVSGSVSSKTSYLVCNEDSNSGKLKKAKDLGIKIISEKELMKIF